MLMVTFFLFHLFLSLISHSTNIPDIRRQVNSIVVSPIGNLAALVDGFGRVLLLDTVSLAIRRMWKGTQTVQNS